MLIDISKSQLMIQLLKQMIAGLPQLSNQDLSLRQCVEEFKNILYQSKQVDTARLQQAIERAQNIASGYELKPHRKNRLVLQLPSVFFHAKTELEHLIKSHQLSNKPAKFQAAAQTVLDIDKFVKQSSRKVRPTSNLVKD